jgi:hypothetical protein
MYKLEMGLSYDPEPVVSDQTCILCVSTITGGIYELVVESPVVQSIYFDQECFHQLMAIGFKMIQQIAADQEVQN